MNDGIGGDLFAIVYEAKTGKLYGLNSGGWSPTGLTPEFLKSKGITACRSHGIYSVTVPGAVEGWDKPCARFGKLKLSDVLAPAIIHAEQGFPVGEVVSVLWHDSESRIRRGRTTAKTYLVDGHVPSEWRTLQEPRSRLVAAPDRRERAGRLLRRGDRARSHPRDLRDERRHHDRRRSLAVRPRMGRARSRRPIAGGRSTNCRRTVRGSRRSRCST